MRILFISNFYPPHDLGGWEQNCQEIVQHLQARGHDCHVLTSRHGLSGQSPTESDITRTIYLQADINYYRPVDFFLRRPGQEKANVRELRNALDAFQPDVIFIWGMWNLSFQVAYWAEQWLPRRVAYAVAGYWFMQPDPHRAYWQQPSRSGTTNALMKPARWYALRRLDREKDLHPLRLDHVACVSEYVRNKLSQAGVLPHGARVIYNGIDPEPFERAAAQRTTNNGLRLIYTGSLLAHKGVHTAIEALGLIKQQGQVDAITLDVVGSGHPDYEAHLQDRVRALNLNDHVVFRGRVLRREIPAILAGHDVFLFTSVYEEPIARTVMEAMAAGLAVVGTPVGGQPEILENGVNALVFQPNDAGQLAECILRLQKDPALRARIVEAGRSTVLDRFTLERMIDEIEVWLGEIVR